VSLSSLIFYQRRGVEKEGEEGSPQVCPRGAHRVGGLIRRGTFYKGIDGSNFLWGKRKKLDRRRKD